MKTKHAKFFALLLAVLLLVPGLALPASAETPEEIEITISHNNPSHYDGIFTVTFHVEDSAGNPVEDLYLRSTIFVGKGSYSTGIRTNLEGDAFMSYSGYAGAEVSAKAEFSGNTSYQAKTVSQNLFTVVENTPVVSCHWELVSTETNEAGLITSYTVGLFDDAGQLIDDTFMLADSSVSVNFSVVNGKHTFTQDAYNKFFTKDLFTLETIVGDTVYSDASLKIFFPCFTLPEPIRYGQAYSAILQEDPYSFNSFEDMKDAAFIVLPDGTEKPLEYVDISSESDPYPRHGLSITLTPEETSQEGTYTLLFRELENREEKYVIMPFSTSIPCKRSVVELTPEKNSLTISPDQIEPGEYVFLDCIPSEGYLEDGIEITVTQENGTELPVTTWEDGTPCFTMPQEDVTVQAVFQKAKTYDVLEGSGSIWEKGSGKMLTFRCDGPFESFTGIKVDDVLLDASCYQAASGSTIVSLENVYLETLKHGEHTITFLYKDGSASASFTIKSPSEEESSSAPAQDSSSESAEDTSSTPAENEENSSPETGEFPTHRNYILLVFLTASAGISLCTFLYFRKKSTTKE